MMAVLKRWCRVGKPGNRAGDEPRREDDLRSAARKKIDQREQLASAERLVHEFHKQETVLRKQVKRAMEQALTWAQRSAAALQAGKPDMAWQAMQRRDETLRGAADLAVELARLRRGGAPKPSELRELDELQAEIGSLLRQSQEMLGELRALTGNQE